MVEHHPTPSRLSAFATCHHPSIEPLSPCGCRGALPAFTVTRTLPASDCTVWVLTPSLWLWGIVVTSLVAWRAARRCLAVMGCGQTFPCPVGRLLSWLPVVGFPPPPVLLPACPFSGTHYHTLHYTPPPPHAHPHTPHLCNLYARRLPYLLHYALCGYAITPAIYILNSLAVPFIPLPPSRNMDYPPHYSHGWTALHQVGLRHLRFAFPDLPRSVRCPLYTQTRGWFPQTYPTRNAHLAPLPRERVDRSTCGSCQVNPHALLPRTLHRCLWFALLSLPRPHFAPLTLTLYGLPLSRFSSHTRPAPFGHSSRGWFCRIYCGTHHHTGCGICTHTARFAFPVRAPQQH